MNGMNETTNINRAAIEEKRQELLRRRAERSEESGDEYKAKLNAAKELVRNTEDKSTLINHEDVLVRFALALYGYHLEWLADDPAPKVRMAVGWQGGKWSERLSNDEDADVRCAALLGELDFVHESIMREQREAREGRQ